MDNSHLLHLFVLLFVCILKAASNVLFKTVIYVSNLEIF